MKKIKKIFPVLVLIILAMSLHMTAHAKTYKESKVTSKQIVAELGKKFKMFGVKTYTKKNDPNGGVLGEPNEYKSKTDFYDKKYRTKYCTVEVFADRYDAVYRQAYLRFLYSIDGSESMIMYRVKNVVIRLNNNMPSNYAKKYYYALKKMIK